MRNSKSGVAVILGSAPPDKIGGAEIQAHKLFTMLKLRSVEAFYVSQSSKSVITKWDTIDLFLIRNQGGLFNILSFIKNLFRFKEDNNQKINTIEFDDNLSDNNTIDNKIPLLYFILYFIPLLYRILWLLFKKRHDYNIIYVPMIESWAFIACISGHLLHKKVVIKDSTMNGITNVLRYPFGKQIQRYIIKQATMFVAMTKIIKENYKKAGIPENRITVIPNGIDIIKTERNPIKGRCLFIGNLYQQPAKGIDVLLKAWISVQSMNNDAHLYVVGDGDLEAYKNYVKQKGTERTVTFLGKQENVAFLLAETDIFVLPSRREGMSNALLEAMNAGVPVIATNISGNQDLITDNDNGFLVEVGDTKELSNKICELLNNDILKNQFSLEAQKRIIKECDISVVCNNYDELFSALNNNIKYPQN